MAEELFSIAQVAERLGLHARTIRNYVREGRLRAVRIGKQYRIARTDLEALAGHPIAERGAVRRERHVEVASVVSVDAIRPEAAIRLSNTLLAAAKGRPENDAPLRIDTSYDEVRARLKVIVSGGLESSSALLALIRTWLENER